MKKILIITLVCMILCFTACSARLPYDLEGTYSIEIHAYGNESAEPVAEFVEKKVRMQKESWRCSVP